MSFNQSPLSSKNTLERNIESPVFMAIVRVQSYAHGGRFINISVKPDFSSQDVISKLQVSISNSLDKIKEEAKKYSSIHEYFDFCVKSKRETYLSEEETFLNIEPYCLFFQSYGLDFVRAVLEHNIQMLTTDTNEDVTKVLKS